MLCRSNKNKRPDKLLQNRLVTLAYLIIAAVIAIVSFVFFPQYFLYLVLLVFVLVVLALYFIIKTFKDAEEAIVYGGLANQILDNESKIKRIDDLDANPIIENAPAMAFFDGKKVLPFLEKNADNSQANKAAIHRLKNAIHHQMAETVALSMVKTDADGNVLGNEEWFNITVRPLALQKSELINRLYSVKAIAQERFFLWTVENVTAVKNMEAVFQQERKDLNNFLDYLPIGLYVANSAYQLEYVNFAFAKLFSQSKEAIQGQNLQNFVASNVKMPTANAPWQGEGFFLDGKKNAFEAMWAQDAFKDADGKIKYRGAIVKGVLSGNSLQQDLSAATDNVFALFDASPVGIMFSDADLIVDKVNPVAANFLQLKNDKLLKRSVPEFLSAADADKLKDEIALLKNKVKASAFIDIHFMSGKVAFMHIVPNIKRHTSADLPIDGFIFYFMDASKQKDLELQFSQAQKMQALGQMAGGVSHDFNNLLTAMIGFCDLLLQRHGVGDPSFSDLIQIKQNANRAAGLVRQLLAFSKKQPLQPKLIDVTENFAELNHMLKRILGEKIVLKIRHENDLGFIRVDPTQFSQVIFNLCNNAKDAMNYAGTLEISTRVESLKEPYQFGADTIAPRDFVVIDVKDSGCGIKPENLSKIFDPFFSTKENVVGSGTGLGLAMVYGIVRQTEGFIKVNSTVGVGTTFSVYLPRFDKSDELPAAKQNFVTAQNGEPVLKVEEKVSSPVNLNEKIILGLNLSSIDRQLKTVHENVKILFTEDEESVRTFAVRALSKKGFKVTACDCAEAALEVLKNDQDFDLLITDMIMPGMNGAELAQEVRKQILNIKVILASGYSEEIARRELAGADDMEFLAKPFSLGDLTLKVTDVLNAK